MLLPAEKTKMPPDRGVSCPAPTKRGPIGGFGKWVTTQPPSTAAAAMVATPAIQRIGPLLVFGVERISQPFAKEVEAKHRHADEDSRIERQSRHAEE